MLKGRMKTSSLSARGNRMILRGVVIIIDQIVDVSANVSVEIAGSFARSIDR
jgi:hypothetical protein